MLKVLFAGCLMLTAFSATAPVALSQTAAPAQTAPANSNIGRDELKKFTVALKQVFTISNETDQKVAQLIEKSGIPFERFREINRAKRDTSFKPTTPITTAEQQTYEQTMVKILEIDKSAKGRMDQAIQSQGIKPERFGQILSAVQKDQNLQKQVEELLKQS